MKFIDIHTHAHTKERDVFQLRNFSVGMEDAAPDFNEAFSVGVHPWKIEPFSAHLYEVNQCAELSNCLAIGECGLDKQKGEAWELQIAAFQAQIQLSEKLQKPLILHVVKAFDAIQQLKKQLKPTQPWLVHGFDKHPELALQLIQHGFYISLGTRLLQHPERLRHLMQAVSQQYLFLETDNSGEKIQSVYAQVAASVGIEESHLRQQIAQNFKTVFGNYKDTV